MTYKIKFEKEDPSMGHVKGLLRVKGKLCFFKFKDSDHAQAMMAKMQQGGAIITSGRSWIRVNMFGEHEEVKLGNEIFEPKLKTEKEVEEILVEYFRVQYTKVGMEIVVTKE